MIDRYMGYLSKIVANAPIINKDLLEFDFWGVNVVVQISIRIMCLLLLILFVGGSVVPEHKKGISIDNPQSTIDSAGESFWWYARISIPWEDDSNPDWPMGLLLADQVFKPVLDIYGSSIQLWRFHRRAGHDMPGHQFRFIFYASQSTASDIFILLRKNEVLMQLHEQQLVQLHDVDVANYEAKNRIEATSDPNWSENLQQAWPLYIMGVSATWLELINKQIGQAQTSTMSTNELRKLYQNVNQSITELWSNEGQHSFLHHLSAIFGYEPLQIRH